MTPNPPDYINLFVAQLPPGEDAFDTARRDPDLLRAIIDAAVPWYQHVFDTEEIRLLGGATGIAGPTPEAKSATVRRLVVVLRSITDPVLRSHYRRRLATIGMIEEVDVRAMLGEPQTERGVGGVEL